MPALPETRAVWYSRTHLPGGHLPYRTQAGCVFASPGAIETTFFKMELSILCNPANIGIVLLRLPALLHRDSAPEFKVGGIPKVFDGCSTLEYISSVLRAARLQRCDLCALTMSRAADVHPGLRGQYSQFGSRVTRVLEEGQRRPSGIPGVLKETPNLGRHAI
jgi:hypothetical protein